MNNFRLSAASVDKAGVVQKLSPRFLEASCCAEYKPKMSTSAFQGLFKHMELLIEFGHLLALCRHFAHGVQHGGVVTATE